MEESQIESKVCGGRAGRICPEENTAPEMTGCKLYLQIT